MTTISIVMNLLVQRVAAITGDSVPATISILGTKMNISAAMSMTHAGAMKSENAIPAVRVTREHNKWSTLQFLILSLMQQEPLLGE